MPLKIMCAGCSKDERDAAEAAVKAALGTAAGSWMVSLVKIGRQWSVTVDGPEVKHKTLVVPDGSLPQALRDLVPPPPAAAPKPAPAPPSPPSAARQSSSTPPAMPRAPLPPTTPPTSRPAVSRPPEPAPTRAPAPARPAIPGGPSTPPTSQPPARPTTSRAGADTLVRPATPPARSPASSAGAAAGRAPSAPRSSTTARAGVRHDRYQCEFCGGAFVVIYESPADSGQETVAVACPHCWKNSHVMISEEAALSRDYRAEKA
jgi:hypothetical protein